MASSQAGELGDTANHALLTHLPNLWRQSTSLQAVLSVLPIHPQSCVTSRSKGACRV